MTGPKKASKGRPRRVVHKIDPDSLWELFAEALDAIFIYGKVSSQPDGIKGREKVWDFVEAFEQTAKLHLRDWKTPIMAAGSGSLKWWEKKILPLVKQAVAGELTRAGFEGAVFDLYFRGESKLLKNLSKEERASLKQRIRRMTPTVADLRECSRPLALSRILVARAFELPSERTVADFHSKNIHKYWNTDFNREDALKEFMKFLGVPN